MLGPCSWSTRIRGRWIRSSRQRHARGSRRSARSPGTTAPPAGAELVEPLLPELTAVIGQTALPAERIGTCTPPARGAQRRGQLPPKRRLRRLLRPRDRRARDRPGVRPAGRRARARDGARRRPDIPRGDAEIRAGTETMFDEGGNGGSFLLAGKTVGIVGCGNLARSLLPLLRPFGCELLGARSLAPRRRAHGARRRAGAPSSSSSPAARSSSSSPRSRPRTSARSAPRASTRWRPARSSCSSRARRSSTGRRCSTAASRGHIRAAIDVFPEEPIPADEPARATPGTILSAHRAGNVPEIWRQVGEMVADDLEALAAGREPLRMQRADPLTVDRLRSRPIG